MDLESIMTERRNAMEKSVQLISVEKLKAMEKDIFPYFDHQWREPFEKFLEENAGGTFYHADAGDGVQIIYCATKEKGMWFIPKQGVGHLQARGLQVMKELIGKK